MKSFVQNKERIFGEILNNFFSQQEISEFSGKFLSSAEHKIKLPSRVSSTDKKQILLELKDDSAFRNSINLLITFASAKLDSHRFLELLLTLGQITITAGEFILSVDLHEKILGITKKNSQLKDVTANAYLALV